MFLVFRCKKVKKVILIIICARTLTLSIEQAPQREVQVLVSVMKIDCCLFLWLSEKAKVKELSTLVLC